jgi:hypothetical protein
MSQATLSIHDPSPVINPPNGTAVTVLPVHGTEAGMNNKNGAD